MVQISFVLVILLAVVIYLGLGFATKKWKMVGHVISGLLFLVGVISLIGSSDYLIWLAVLFSLDWGSFQIALQQSSRNNYFLFF